MLSVDDLNKILILSKTLGVSQAIASLLFARGYTNPDSAYKFLHPSLQDLTPPEAFNGMLEGAEIIKRHIANGSKITVYGDYDADGIGASAILYLAISNAGGNVDTFIPSRQEDGYGLSFDALKRVIELQKPDLIVSVDCGIGSPAEVAYAKSLGIEFIVTDHHEPPRALPDCVLIDPKLQPGMPELCGAGVAWMLVEAFAGMDEAMKYLDICAVSTIADLVPLVGDNRIIAKAGLKMLGSPFAHKGFKALLKVSGCNFGEPVDSYTISFKLAPRLNASGRLSTAIKSLRLLISNDDKEIATIAEDLDEENRTRQDICQVIYKSALEMLSKYDLNNSRIIILKCNDWESGVIGIAATRIAQEFNRPTILCTTQGDVIRGSGRSIKGVNLHDAIGAASEYVEQFGGHSMAAGLTIKEENIDAFRKKVNDYLYATTSADVYKPEYFFDAEIDLNKVDMKFMDDLTSFEPYGMNNPKPMFMHEVKACNFVRLGIHNHIRFTSESGLSVIGFNFLWRLAALKENMTKRVFFALEKEYFHGRASIKAFLKNVEVSEINPSEGTLIEHYFDKYLPMPEPQKGGRRFEKSQEYGHLIICFSYDMFEKMCEEHPDYAKHFGGLPSLNPYNAVLLAPDVDINLSFYSQIDIMEETSPDYVEFLRQSYSAEINYQKNTPVFKTLVVPCRDSLRNAYVYIRRITAMQNITSMQDVYFAIKTIGYRAQYPEFLISYLILEELQLIKVRDNGAIYVICQSAEPQNSKILNRAYSLYKSYSK